jgi:beta-lactamase class A
MEASDLVQIAGKTGTRRSPLLTFVFSFALIIAGLPASPGATAPATQAANVVTYYGSAPDAPDSELQAIIEEVVSELPGTWGVAVKKLDTGQYASYNGDVQQVSASLYKMWVLCELYRQAKEGIVSLDQSVTVTSEDAYYDALIGELRLPAGNVITLWQAARLMVQVSDNTSAALLVRVLGPNSINRHMKELGLNDSILDWDGAGDNLTTPLDMLKVFEMIATSAMVDQESSGEMIELMLGQQINNLLPPGLPDGTDFAHKTGALDKLLHDAGIVYSPSGPYVIIAMASEMDDFGTAWRNWPLLSERVYSYFNERPATPTLYFPQTRQSVGHDFLKFWNAHGGVDAFGYPISPEQMSGDVVVQHFERGRFEWHAGNAGAGGPQPTVVLGLVGQERASQLGLTWQRASDPGTGKFFPETGQVITGEFRNYWLNHGQERVFGLPISPAAEMKSPSDGKTYLTQWFQRARMEMHPELPAGERVVLGTLGAELSSPR